MDIKTLNQIRSKRKKLTNINEIKTLGGEVIQEHNILAQQALDLLNGQNKQELDILSKVKVDANGVVYYKLGNGLHVILNQ